MGISTEGISCKRLGILQNQHFSTSNIYWDEIYLANIYNSYVELEKEDYISNELMKEYEYNK